MSETGGVDIWLSKVDLSGSCDGCLIDNICYPPGKPEPGNVCAICDPDQSSDAWTPRDGIACNDGLFCTGIDFCRDGACADHSGDPCAPESCDEEYNCCGNCWFGDDDHDDGDPVDDDTVASADDDSAVPSDDDAVESDVTKSDAACCGA
ncbi:MAG: hypothetical protein M5R36_04645 [Deltaproteobacteria bacterium]|nr:hypothetical protein [Deltaproteobacteria bacterium]